MIPVLEIVRMFGQFGMHRYYPNSFFHINPLLKRVDSVGKYDIRIITIPDY